MPFTPSHAVVALPFVRTPLLPTAIAIGAMTPDLPLFLRGTPLSYQATHTNLLLSGLLALALLVVLEDDDLALEHHEEVHHALAPLEEEGAVGVLLLARERAEARFKKAEQAAEASREAMAQYAAEAQAVEDKTARLKALRLAKEEAEAQAAPPPKAAPARKAKRAR